jgi:hypothetical protein
MLSALLRDFKLSSPDPPQVDCDHFEEFNSEAIGQGSLEAAYLVADYRRRIRFKPSKIHMHYYLSWFALGQPS